MSKIIEFYGLPGSGKTFIKDRLKKVLEEKGVKQIDDKLKKRNKLMRIVYKLFIACQEFIAYPGRFFSLMKMVSKSGQKTKWDWAVVLFNWILMRSLYNRPFRDGIILVDQGMFQAVWSTLLNAENEISVEDIISESRAGFPNVLCVVDVSRETMEQGIKERDTNDSRLEKTDKEESKQLLDKGIAVHELIMDYITKNRCEYVIVDNNDRDDSIDKAVQELADRIAD